jgi:hypothetical protein
VEFAQKYEGVKKNPACKKGLGKKHSSFLAVLILS